MELNQEYFDKKFKEASIERIKGLRNLEQRIEQKIDQKIDQKIEWLARLINNTIAIPYQRQLNNHETRISKLEQN